MCSELRRWGLPRAGHYDTRMIDALQFLAQANHGAVLHPHWKNASDYKSTSETLRTIALNDEELAVALEGVPNVNKTITLTHDMCIYAAS